MTWHPLATNPLPEPRKGQVLLIIRSDHPHPVTYACPSDDSVCWWGGCDNRTPSQLREDWLQTYPGAQWFLVPAPGEQSEADELRKRVAELEDLVSRAIRCSHRVTSLKVPRWACVKRVFSVGSTRAHELCRSYGLDPDEKVGGKS